MGWLAVGKISSTAFGKRYRSVLESYLVRSNRALKIVSRGEGVILCHIPVQRYVQWAHVCFCVLLGGREYTQHAFQQQQHREASVRGSAPFKPPNIACSTRDRSIPRVQARRLLTTELVILFRLRDTTNIIGVATSLSLCLSRCSVHSCQRMLPVTSVPRTRSTSSPLPMYSEQHSLQETLPFSTLLGRCMYCTATKIIPRSPLALFYSNWRFLFVASWLYFYFSLSFSHFCGLAPHVVSNALPLPFPRRSPKTEEPKSFARRDRLAAMEGPAQERWRADKVFEAKAEFNDDGSPKEKFMVTFPYPYMNGRLHLGHAYSMSKVRVARCVLCDTTCPGRGVGVVRVVACQKIAIVVVQT